MYLETKDTPGHGDLDLFDYDISSQQLSTEELGFGVRGFPPPTSPAQPYQVSSVQKPPVIFCPSSLPTPFMYIHLTDLTSGCCVDGGVDWSGMSMKMVDPLYIGECVGFGCEGYLFTVWFYDGDGCVEENFAFNITYSTVFIASCTPDGSGLVVTFVGGPFILYQATITANNVPTPLANPCSVLTGGQVVLGISGMGTIMSTP